MRKPPDHHQSADAGQARFNRATVDALEFVLKRAGVDYDIVTVDIDTSATVVPYRLGRPWTGWQVVDIGTAATVHRDASSTSTSLRLVASSAASDVKVLVF